MEAACAIAAKLCPAEVPMMVPKNMGPDVAGCWFDALLLSSFHKWLRGRPEFESVYLYFSLETV